MSRCTFINQYGYGDRYYYYVLNKPTSDATQFSLKVAVNGVQPDTILGGPISKLTTINAQASLVGTGVMLRLAPNDVVFVLIDKGTVFNVNTQSLANENISIYPNPAHDHIHINLGGEGFTRLEILDISGRIRLAQSVGVDARELDIYPNLSAGIYFVRIFKGNESSVYKLIVE